MNKNRITGLLLLLFVTVFFLVFVGLAARHAGNGVRQAVNASTPAKAPKETLRDPDAGSDDIDLGETFISGEK
jgi:hypothetical protein